MSAQPEQYSEELLADLVNVVEQSLLKRGVEKELARKAGFEAAENLRQRWGGMQLYFPQGMHFALSQRDLELWNEFSGDNHKALAAKYDVCEDRVYKIVKRMKAAQLRLRQADIFDESAGKGV